MPLPGYYPKELLKYCVSDQEKEYVNAVLSTGSLKSAAAQVGKNYNTVRNAIERVKSRAAKMGFAPEYDLNHPAPAPFLVKGTSTLYDEEGKPRMQWVKTGIDGAQLEQLVNDFIEASKENVPKERPIKPPSKNISNNCINCHIITDYHFGQYSWSEETRQGDWDVNIAEERLINWFKYAIAAAPPAEGAVLCFLGDDLHQDGMENLTPASKHILDSDSRFSKVIRLWIRVRRRINAMLLAKYSWVHVIEAEGNHNPVSSIWMREWLSALYEDEPRLTVDTSVDPYYCYEWGDTSLFFHHGHKRRPTNIDDVFVAKFREVFGRTKHSYGHMGHLHHRDVKETSLMTIEQHRTLAESDSYASRHGFISGQEAQVITYHKKHGEVSRLVVSPSLVEEACA